MDSRPECLPAPIDTPVGAAIRRGVRVRRGLAFDVATEADPRDPVSRELALGVFPPICGPAFDLMDALVPPRDGSSILPPTSARSAWPGRIGPPCPGRRGVPSATSNSST